MLVLIDNRQNYLELDDKLQDLIESAVATVLENEGWEENFEISISLVEDAEMQELNEKYRGIASTTDVLSFPLMDFDESEPVENVEDFIDEELALGDIVISTKRAAEQAEDYGHSLEREIAFLTVHGMLHLLGDDHDVPEKEAIMLEKQTKIFEKLGITRA